MSSRTLTIRTYVQEDSLRLADIYRPHVETSTLSFELEPPDGLEMNRRFTSLLARGFPVLTALQGSKIVGYAYVAPFRERPAYLKTVEHSVYVDPAHQRAGAGQALMEQLTERCRDLGFRQMVAAIADEQNDGAASVRFHQRIGFRWVGRLDGVGIKFGRELSVTLMQRAI